MNSSIIFLDFDGVLNTEQYQARLAVAGKPNKDTWGPLFDPCAVGNLRKIIESTGAGIVISSSWRYIRRLGSLHMMWEIRELPGEILDTLPCGASYISRGEDIEYWLKKHAQVNYVIIDDINDFYTSQLDRYVETTPLWESPKQMQQEQ